MADASGFDIEGARKSGYSNQEIIGHLTSSRKFDVDGAKKAGYSEAEIIQHLATAPKKTQSPPSMREKVGGYLKSLPNPFTFKPNYGPDVQDVDTGPSYGLMKMAAPGTAVMQGVKGLFAKGAEGAPSAAEAVASKIPKIHPFAKFLAKRIPGVGGALDLIEMIRDKGIDVNSIPKAGRDELAFQLHKETTGKLPETATEKVAAIKNFQAALKTPGKAKPTGPEPTITQPKLAHQLYEETHGAPPATASEKVQAVKELRKALRTKRAKGKEGTPDPFIRDEHGQPLMKKGTEPPGEAATTPSTTPGLGAKIGKQYPKQAPPGDMRRQVFVNLKTALKGEGGGTVTATENKAFRALVEKTYGKRVSAMSDAELDQVMRDIPKLAEQLRAGVGVG